MIKGHIYIFLLLPTFLSAFDNLHYHEKIADDLTFYEALEYCDELSHKQTWRLPTLKELQKNSVLILNKSTMYWTETVIVNGNLEIWDELFYEESSLMYGRNRASVICVK